MFSSSDTVLHDRPYTVDYASSNVSNQRSNFTQKLSQSDIFLDSKRYIDVTSDHRNNFKAFIHVYMGVADILANCERSLQRLSESQDCQYGPSSTFCRMISELVHNLNASLSQQSVDEMKHMKTIVKDKLMAYDLDVKARLKEVLATKQNMEKHDGNLERIQGDIRKVHSSITAGYEGSGRRSSGPSWNPIKLAVDDKDKLFERIQKLKLERERVANDSEYELNQLVSKHLQSFNKLSVSVNEMSSIRRRLNRKVLTEIQAVVPRIQAGLDKLLPVVVPSLIEVLEKSLPSNGDFGMRLPPAEMSVSCFIGCDREAKLARIKSGDFETDVIEYRAVQTYIAKEAGELNFLRNERIDVLHKESSGWWFGRNEKGLQGYFPSVLVGERPANAPLPTESSHKESYRPKLVGGHENTWRSAPSMEIVDERVSLIQSHAEGTFVGLVHFPFYNDDICIESNDVVEIGKLSEDQARVVVRNDRNQVGLVPLNILTVKFRHEKENLVNSN